MIVRKSASLTLALSILIVTGCKLSDNAQKSADNSQLAAQNSTNLLDLNQNAYGDGRQGGSRERRENALASMERATALESKMVSAASYFSAMEYQLFKNEGFREDNPEKRARLQGEGISEFLKIQKDYAKPSLDADPVTGNAPELRASLGRPEYLNAFALAGALHKISERQIEASKRYRFTVQSPLDLFAQALASKAAVEGSPASLASAPTYVYEILRESRDSILLLELRANLMTGTALQALGAEPVAVDATTGELRIQASAVQLQDSIDRMKAAIQTILILNQGGITPRYFADVGQGIRAANAKLSAIPVASLEEKKHPKLPKLREVQALVTKLAGAR